MSKNSNQLTKEEFITLLYTKGVTVCQGIITRNNETKEIIVVIIDKQQAKNMVIIP